MKCPNCNCDIRWHQIAFASYPVWITCKNCETKLVGNTFIKLQAVFVLLLAGAVFFGVLLASWSLPIKYLALFVGLSFVVGFNVWLTLFKGDYRVRNQT